MVTSLKMRSNTTSANTGQDRLRAMLLQSPAAHRFLALFGTPLDPFVGEVNKVFEAPKAEGGDFDFAPGTRTAFLNLVDPSTRVGKIGPATFAGSAPKAKMVPDNPGAGHPDQAWRVLASAAGVGISFREPGLAPSLHIAIRRFGADVHLDREGFVTTIDGRIRYDPKRVLNHLTADLASDHVPGLVSSLTVKDPSGKTSFEGTFAPWLEVNLPGSVDMAGKRRGGTEYVVGFRLFGIFSAGGG